MACFPEIWYSTMVGTPEKLTGGILDPLGTLTQGLSHFSIHIRVW